MQSYNRQNTNLFTYNNMHNRCSSGNQTLSTENDINSFLKQVPDGTTQTMITTTTKAHTILVQVTTVIVAVTTLDRTTGSVGEGAAAAPAMRPRSPRRPTTTTACPRGPRPASTCRRPPATTTCTHSLHHRRRVNSSLNKVFYLD